MMSIQAHTGMTTSRGRIVVCRIGCTRLTAILNLVLYPVPGEHQSRGMIDPDSSGVALPHGESERVRPCPGTFLPLPARARRRAATRDPFSLLPSGARAARLDKQPCGYDSFHAPRDL